MLTLKNLDDFFEHTFEAFGEDRIVERCVVIFVREKNGRAKRVGFVFPFPDKVVIEIGFIVGGVVRFACAPCV